MRRTARTSGSRKGAEGSGGQHASCTKLNRALPAGSGQQRKGRSPPTVEERQAHKLQFEAETAVNDVVLDVDIGRRSVHRLKFETRNAEETVAELKVDFFRQRDVRASR